MAESQVGGGGSRRKKEEEDEQERVPFAPAFAPDKVTGTCYCTVKAKVLQVLDSWVKRDLVMEVVVKMGLFKVEQISRPFFNALLYSSTKHWE